jgi:glutamate synthase domain-containing protein 3
MRIDAQGMHYRELNALLREAVARGDSAVEIVNVNGQRYIADGLRASIAIDIHGVPGNDLCAFTDGPRVVVHGNAQDGVANTMNSGCVVVHGDAGDVLGYGMRGGQLLVKGNVGYRVGIHMKAYGDQVPAIVVGGAAGDFLGEYMAGGTLVVLGLNGGSAPVGAWCGTGMHGGEIFVRGSLDEHLVAHRHVAVRPANGGDLDRLRPLIETFCSEFGVDSKRVLEGNFWRLAPRSSRPYGSKYAG